MYFPLNQVLQRPAPNPEDRQQYPDVDSFRLRLVISALAILLLTSCKLRIIVPEGGSVVANSGAFNCAPGETCDIDVVDLFFDETFVAKPADGYKFKFWRKGNRRLCGRKKTTCSVTTSGHNPDIASVISSFLSTDEVFYLQPVFECIPEQVSHSISEFDTTITPTAAGAELLFVSDFETGSIQGRFENRDGWGVFSQGLQNAIVVQKAVTRRGNYASKHYLEKADWDGTNNPQGEGKPRAQLVKSVKSLPIKFDTDYWLGVSTFIPSDWIDDKNPDNGVVLWEFHASGGVSPYVPPLSLAIEGDTMRIVSHFGDVQSSIGTRSLWACGYPKGTWIDWIVNVRFSLEKGFVRVWKNGEQIVEYSGKPTMFYDSKNLERKPLYLALGLYKPKYVKIPNTVISHTLYVDEVRVASGGPDAKFLVTP